MHGTAGIARVATRSEQLMLSALGFAFFASGFAALLYQVIWQRMLGLFAGSDAVTASLVVGAFLLGLGIGSLIAGLFADRLTPRQAAIAFAVCEIGIAGFALLSRPFLYDLVVERIGPLATSRWQIFGICFAGLLAPTLLMGLSLPLLSKAVVARVETAAKRIGLLYGVNTLGAAAGTLLGGMVIVGSLGFEASIQLGAVLNLVAAALALAMLGRLPASLPPMTTRAANQGAATTLGLPGWTLLVFLSGFFIIALEILWVRVLGVASQGTAYAFSLILGIFLVGDALGVLAGARWIDRLGDPRRAFLVVQSAAALYAAITLAGFWALYGYTPFTARFGIELYRTDPTSIAITALIAAVLILPPAFLLGITFPLAQKGVQRDIASLGWRVGVVQLGNIVGNATGSLCAGLVLLHVLGTAGTAKALFALAALMMAAWLLVAWRERISDRLSAGLAAALCVAILAFPGNAGWWGRIHGAAPNRTLAISEDRSGLAVLRLQDGAGPMFIGGHTQSRVPFWPHHFFLGALGSLIHPEPLDILVVGSGSGGTPYGAGWNPLTRRVRTIELVAPVYDVIRAHAATAPRSAAATMLRDPRFELVVGDGRHEILAGGQVWDVVEADAILPQTSHSGMLYSVEFLRLVRDRLKPGGMFVQWAPTERVVRGFTETFPHVVFLLPGSFLVGSNEPIAFDVERLRDRLADPAFLAAAAAADVPTEGMARLFAEPPRIWLPATPRPRVALNTDLFPRDEFYLNNPIRGVRTVFPGQ